MKTSRKVKFWEALILFFVCVMVMLLGAISWKTATGANLGICAAIVAAYACFVCKIQFNDLIKEAVKNVQRAFPSILFIMIVGAVAGSWIACGTVPFIMYWGLKLINPKMLLFITYLVLAIVSMATGQAWSTITSIGVAMGGVAIGLGVPVPLAAGAAVSGAFLGDKWSPISDVPALNAGISGVSTFRIFSHMMPTSGLGALIAGVLYLIVGFFFTADSVDVALTAEMLNGLSGTFNLNFLVLLPLLVMLALSIFTKLPTTPVVFGSVVLAVITGAIFQHKSIIEMLGACWSGAVVSGSGSEVVDKLLTKGGVSSFASLIILLLIALVFAGFLTRAGVLDAIMEKLSKVIKSRGTLILISSLTSVLMVWCTSSVYVSMILNFTLYQKLYCEKFGLHRINLCRTVNDCAPMFGAIVPWSNGAILASTAFGIPAMSYAPYVWACYIPIILGIIYGYVGKDKMYPTYEQELAEEAAVGAEG